MPGSEDSAKMSDQKPDVKELSKDIESYDKKKLEKVPSKEGSTPAQSRDMTLAG